MQGSDYSTSENGVDEVPMKISEPGKAMQENTRLPNDTFLAKADASKMDSGPASSTVEIISEPKPVVKMEAEKKIEEPSSSTPKVIDLLSSEDENAASRVQDMSVDKEPDSSDDEMDNRPARKGADVSAGESEENDRSGHKENEQLPKPGEGPPNAPTRKEMEVTPEHVTAEVGEKGQMEPISTMNTTELKTAVLLPDDDAGSNSPTTAGISSAKRDSSSLSPTSNIEPDAKKQKEEHLPPPPRNAVTGEKVLPETVAPDPVPIHSTPPGAAHKPEKVEFQMKGADSSPVSMPAKPQSSAQPSQPITNKKSSASHCDPEFAALVNLDPIPDVALLPEPTARDIAELESYLQIGDKYNNGPEDGWREDWSGNLQLYDKEVVMNRNIMAQNPQAKPITLPFCEWVSNSSKTSNGFRGIQLLFSYVYHMKGTPPMAQKIMAFSLRRTAKTVDQRLKYIVDAVRRISYDPEVLRQDGWTTAKAASPDGASGGAFLIGRRVMWHKYEAIVIAFVRDEELGDLWKAMWFEDLDTFDLEADELQEALKKWEAREARKAKAAGKQGAKPLSGGYTAKGQGSAAKTAKPTGSIRFASSTNFTVKGIEHGIILAASLNPNARLGVLWPARVMHASEIRALGSQQTSRRSSSKNTIHVVFLAPYWNGHYGYAAKGRSDPSRNSPTDAKNAFSTGPLFEMDTVEVSDTTIQPYPYDDSNGERLSIDNLQQAFRFLGLPKAAFTRFLDSHRLAIALKAYGRKELAKTRCSVGNEACHASSFAALTDTHTMSARTALFPASLLNLPFDFILSSLPPPDEQASQLIGNDGEEVSEPIIQLHLILKAMTPPLCWGRPLPFKKDSNGTAHGADSSMIYSTPQSMRGLTPVSSPDPKFSSSASTTSGSVSSVIDDPLWSLNNFASDYLLGLTGSGSDGMTSDSPLSLLGKQLAELIALLQRDLSGADSLEAGQRRQKQRLFLRHCLLVKGHGEDFLASKEIPTKVNVRNVLLEWRKACERVFKRASVKFSLPGFGNSVTTVITDSRCNQHLTASGSFERAVRLPAAIRGAKQIGFGSDVNLRLITKVDDEYMDLAEKKILPKAHKASYLRRIKTKIAALPPDAKGAPLTDDSDGEGGEDTMGSRGSYTAAIAGVAAAMQAADMVVGGQSVNVFCAVRPPGHHAGRDLRPLNAVSNGFCLLNAVACAALYATSPRSEGGLGLKRVCVIDFDVHHGNGTQDILCSTYDSRFLYVSLHAGGAHINGFDDGNDSENDDGLRRSLGNNRQEGIFPGRCGDTSPHEGVLNIPLGQKVTAHAIGNALVSKVSPAVEAFAPDLIVLSAGFDAHKNDPLGMGGLSAEDFGSVTDVACQMGLKTCSGRVISVLEGGYGVPCCRPRDDTFLPENIANTMQPARLLELGEDLPDSMEDAVPYPLQQKLDRCHAEGFLECVKEHVGSLSRYNTRGPAKK